MRHQEPNNLLAMIVDLVLVGSQVGIQPASRKVPSRAEIMYEGLVQDAVRAFLWSFFDVRAKDRVRQRRTRIRVFISFAWRGGERDEGLFDEWVGWRKEIYRRGWEAFFTGGVRT